MLWGKHSFLLCLHLEILDIHHCPQFVVKIIPSLSCSCCCQVDIRPIKTPLMYSHLTEKFIEKFKTSNPHYEDKLFPHNIVLHHLAAVHRHKSHKIMSTTPERPSNQEILDLNVILLKLTQTYKLYSSHHISLLILIINSEISACLAMGLSFLFLLGPTVLDLVLVFTACLS